LRIREILRQTQEIPSIDIVAIIGFVLSRSTAKVLAGLEEEIGDETEVRIRACIEERKAGKPLAYITGAKEFFSEAFLVDGRVLVPRPETELLVEEALRLMAAYAEPRVLDVGTGSGAIGIMLARHGAHAVCADLSFGALLVARENAARLGVSERTTFVCGDLMASIKEERVFDLIVANLPYVSASEWEGLMEDVKAFEPRTALVGGVSGVEIYERFIASLRGHLSPLGHVLCEVAGDDVQAGLVAEIFEKEGLQGSAVTDLEGRKRVLKGTWKSLS
jgi:release factor glutamine methyltransferase